MDRSERLASGSIPRLLASFSFPAVVGMIAQALYNVVDRIFVGRAVGQNGIAGTTVAFPFMLILLACGLLVGVGAASLVSIRLGERRRGEAERVLGNAAILLVALSAVLTLVGQLFLDELLHWFGASATVLPFARDYLRILIWGAVFQVVGFGLNAVIRGEGNPRVAMLTLLIGVALNAVLAPVFIFVLGWGMKGAAAATVIAQAVSLAWVLLYFFGGHSTLRFRWENLWPQAPTALGILSVGSPLFAVQLASSLINSLLNNQLRFHGGDTAIAIMGIIYASVMMIAMPVFGINQGAQPIIGYNFGAGKPDRVRQTLHSAILAATAVTVSGFLVMALFPAQLIRLFNPDDEALVALGCHAIRISTLMLPFVGFQVIGASYFQSVGKPRKAMFLSLSRQVLLLIPAILILPRFFGLNGIWAAMPAADLGASLLTGLWLFHERRHARAGVPPPNR